MTASIVHYIASSTNFPHWTGHRMCSAQAFSTKITTLREIKREMDLLEQIEMSLIRKYLTPESMTRHLQIFQIPYLLY